MNETIIITDNSEHKLELRNLQLEDYADLKAIMDIVYPMMSHS